MMNLASDTVPLRERPAGTVQIPRSFFADARLAGPGPRIEVDAAETAQNPRGHITEPGFRVIFPVDRLGSRPGQLRLDGQSARAVPY